MSTLVYSLIEAHDNLRIEPYENLAILNEFALDHVNWMNQHKSLTHSSLKIPGLSTLSVAENIAYGHKSVQTVMRAWLRSPGHRRNIMGNYQCIGAATYNAYWCVVFANLYDPPISL